VVTTTRTESSADAPPLDRPGDTQPSTVAADDDDDRTPPESQRGDHVSFKADEPAISGACYTVVDVDGHPPAALADFARDAAMTLLMNGQTRRVIGSGVNRSGSVRFHQKDPGLDGKDVRVWTITVRGDLFLAEPAAAI
jgi:hypothetical protein